MYTAIKYFSSKNFKSSHTGWKKCLVTIAMQHWKLSGSIPEIVKYQFEVGPYEHLRKVSCLSPGEQFWQ